MRTADLVKPGTVPRNAGSEPLRVGVVRDAFLPHDERQRPLASAVAALGQVQLYGTCCNALAWHVTALTRFTHARLHRVLRRLACIVQALCGAITADAAFTKAPLVPIPWLSWPEGRPVQQPLP